MHDSAGQTKTPCKKHSESDRLAQCLVRAKRLKRSWAGVVFRSSSLRYANRDDFLTGAGAKASGARWNPPRSFAALYTSIEPDTAVLESLAHQQYYSLPVEDALPRVLAAVRVVLRSVLDLTDVRIRKALRVSRELLIAEDWREANRNGVESLTQALGRLAWASEWEGILVPSAPASSKENLIIFPGNLTPPASYLLVLNRDRLPKPPFT